jgi:hypothetical protein
MKSIYLYLTLSLLILSKIECLDIKDPILKIKVNNVLNIHCIDNKEN